MLYRNAGNEIKKKIRYLLFVLRLFVISFLSFYLLNPIIRNTQTYIEKPVVLIAADNSASVLKNKDSVFYKTQFLTKLRQFESALQDKYEVHVYHFDRDLVSGDTLSYSGKETNLSNVITKLQNNFEGKNVGALILASDGLYNTGANPVTESDRIRFPIYTLALGDTTVRRDAQIKKVNHNQTAYIGNQFPVEVVVQSFDLQGREAILHVSRNGEKIAEQRVSYTSANYSGSFTFLLQADKAGIQRYELALSLLNEEAVKTNNVAEFVVDVIDKREKVLILASAPHPDIIALKLAIEANQSYEVEVQLAEHFIGSLKPYSLLILHQVNQNNSADKRISMEMASNNTPLWQFSKNDFWAFPGLRFASSVSRYSDAEPFLNKNFSLFNISTELKNYIREFPAINCALASYKLTNGTVALLNQQIGQVETENPIILFASNTNQKSALFCGEGIWRWKLRDFSDHQNNVLFEELIQKTVQYLAIKADKSFFRVNTKKIINENDPLEFDAEVYNPSYERINEAEVSMLITNEAKKQFQYTFSKTENSYHLNAGNFPPGKYSFEAKVKTNNELYIQKGTFLIKPLLAEYTHTCADHALLYRLSKATGGQMYDPGHLEELQKKLLEQDVLKPLVHEKKQVSDLIDLKIYFFILLTLLSLEWFIRKYNGLS